MTAPTKSGGELFIVDNSDEAWKGLKYLQDWTEIASSFDIATGFFKIGSLLALDGKWQKLDNSRPWLAETPTGASSAVNSRQRREGEANGPQGQRPARVRRGGPSPVISER